MFPPTVHIIILLKHCTYFPTWAIFFLQLPSDGIAVPWRSCTLVSDQSVLVAGPQCKWRGGFIREMQGFEPGAKLILMDSALRILRT